MDKQNIIGKIKAHHLLGRGGAAFPTAIKWEAVQKASGKKKYIVCNGSEGEPGVFKDGFILKKYPAEVINGIKIALQTFPGSAAYIYLRRDYFSAHKKRLEKLAKGLPITIIKEMGGYLCGEESTLLESIEGHRFEPRAKPPYPTEKGLFACPTLINNVETFFAVSQIAKDEYKNTRFFSLSGDLPRPGVYQLPEDWSIKRVLKETNNWPRGDFFVQNGGGASGVFLTLKELNQKICGAGAIVVYAKKKHRPTDLAKKWLNFYFQQNCGRCLPCREGVYRLKELLEKNKLTPASGRDILLVLKQTSFCPLGKSLAVPLEGLFKKIWEKI
ncbi:MAG: NADH-ubiquinone oxidoreductase-F iron-sulfur binding region domain-containing protein [bacterium]|nr:NADH-ubiquinone oxidoreductase-F iron-sulfur binding region domain-containing protein [bacterium]